MKKKKTKINWSNVLFYLLLAIMLIVIVQSELLLNDIRKWNKENLVESEVECDVSNNIL